MPPKLSQRASEIEESATLAIASKAAELRRQGMDVVSLGAGEPDFDTVEEVAAAGIRAIQDCQTRYTPASGIPELREAAATWFQTTYGLSFSRSQVMVTAGAKPALHMALMTLVEPADPVLIPAPYWVSYPDMVKIAAGTPIALAPVPEQGFIHSGDQILAAAREHRARGIILNYPGNPSGAVPSREQMQGIVAACAEADLWILSDEIYGQLIYDGLPHVSPAALPEGQDRTVVVNGGTKSHSMTGWRVGFMAGPEDLIAAAGRIQSQCLGNTSTISQHAAMAACTGDHRAELARRLKEFDRRRQFLVAEVNKINGLSLRPPMGSFYAMVDARKLCDQMAMDDTELCERMLTDCQLAVVPGSPFALPGFFRLSYAASMEELEKAMERLRDFAARG